MWISASTKRTTICRKCKLSLFKSSSTNHSQPSQSERNQSTSNRHHTTHPRLSKITVRTTQTNRYWDATIAINAWGQNNGIHWRRNNSSIFSPSFNDWQVFDKIHGLSEPTSWPPWWHGPITINGHHFFTAIISNGPYTWPWKRPRNKPQRNVTNPAQKTFVQTMCL